VGKLPRYVAPGADRPPRPSKAALGQVERVMARSRADLLEMTQVEIDTLLPVLRRAREELKRDLARWLRDVDQGADRFTAQRYRQALLQLEETFEMLGEGASRDLARVLGIKSQKAGKAALQHLRREVEAYADVFSGTIKPLALPKALIMERGEDFLIPRFRTSAARYMGAVRTDIRRQLAVGMARGESIEELTNRLAKQAGPRGWVSLRGVKGEPGAIVEHIAEGLFKRYRFWGERVVRTETAHAYNVHRQLGLEEADRADPGYRRQLDASLDARRCDRCGDLDLAVADLDKPFPGGVMFAPLHPNCRCIVVPYRDEWADDLREEK
jgi:hypothetical protein